MWDGGPRGRLSRPLTRFRVPENYRYPAVSNCVEGFLFMKPFDDRFLWLRPACGTLQPLHGLRPRRIYCNLLSTDVVLCGWSGVQSDLVALSPTPSRARSPIRFLFQGLFCVLIRRTLFVRRMPPGLSEYSSRPGQVCALRLFLPRWDRIWPPFVDGIVLYDHCSARRSGPPR